MSFDEFSAWMNSSSDTSTDLRQRLLKFADLDADDTELAIQALEAPLANTAALVFDLGELLEDFLQGDGAEEASVYIGAAAEVVASSALQVSANTADSQGKKTVNASHLYAAVANSSELSSVYERGSAIKHLQLLPLKDKAPQPDTL